MANLVSIPNITQSYARTTAISIPLAPTGSTTPTASIQYLMCANRSQDDGAGGLFVTKVYWQTVSGSIDTTGTQQDRFPTNELSLIRLVKTIT